MILTALGHEAVHVNEAGHRSSTDFVLVEFAREFDVFVTLDLHRQEAEWLAVNRALIEGGIKVLRIRLPRRSKGSMSNIFRDIVRSLVYRIEWWETEFAAGKCLVTIRELGTVESARTREEVLEMLESRKDTPSKGPDAS